MGRPPAGVRGLLGAPPTGPPPERLRGVDTLRSMTEVTSTARRTPLYSQHVELGGKIVDFAGWEMPVTFEGIREEHSAVRRHAGVFDVSHMGEVEVEGTHALKFLQRAVSNDVSKVEVGGAQYQLLCQEDGGIVDDLFLYRLGHDRYLIVTNAANHGVDLTQLGGVAREFDVTVRDVADRYAMLAVQGPHARGIVERALGLKLPPRMQVAPVKIGGRPALACGTGYTGEDGVELLIDPEVAAPVWAELVEAGVVPCGLGARDTLRLEVCFPLHGNELSTGRNPIEAGLGWACKEETGFVGSEAVAAARRDGTVEKLAPFLIEGGGIPRGGNPVLADDQAAGVVTSGTFAPSLQRGAGMAYVRSELAQPGTEVEIDVRGKRRPARIASKPLYERS